MIRAQILKYLPGAREGEGGGSKGTVRRGAMEKSKYVRVFEGKEVRRDDPIKYFLPTTVGNTFRVPEGLMAIEVPRMKRSLEKERVEGEKESVLPSDGEERMEGA